MPRWKAAASMTAMASGARQRTSKAQPVISRAAVDRRVQVAPTVLGDPDAGHVEVPELVRSGDMEVAGPASAAFAASRLQQPVLAHQSLAALAVDRSARAPGGDRGDHPACRRWRARPRARRRALRGR